jgi:hypothetical protein
MVRRRTCAVSNHEAPRGSSFERGEDAASQDEAPTASKFETMGAEAGPSMRKNVDGGWPGLIERFVREADRSKS